MVAHVHDHHDPGRTRHGRHPRPHAVVLEPDAWDLWLDPEDHDRAARRDLLQPTVPGTLAHHRVDTRVGNVRNDDPGLIVPVTGPAQPTPVQPMLAGLGED